MEKKLDKIRLSMTAVVFILLVVPHFKPTSVDEIECLAWLDVVSNILRIISSIVVIFLFFVRRRRITPILGMIICLETSLFFSTIINECSLYTFCKCNFFQVIMFMLISVYIDEWKKLLNFLFLLAEIFTYSNLAAIILKPDGLYVSTVLKFHHNWILGYKNMFFPYFYCFMVIALLYKESEKRYIRPYMLLGAMLVSLILAKAVAACIVLSISFIMLFWAKKDANNILNSYVLLIINCILFIIVFNFRDESIWLNMIAHSFHKDITLTGRTYIWKGIMSAIAQKPIMGWGMENGYNTLSIIGAHDGTNAHNIILQFLYNGGIVATFFWGLCIYLFSKKLYQFKETYTAKVLTTALFVFNIASLTEAYFAEGYQGNLIFLVLALIDNLDCIIAYEKEEGSSIKRSKNTLASNP